MPPNQYARMGPYQTQLSSQEETQFRQWLQQHSDQPPIANFNPNDPKADYDMRGYWKAAKAGDPRTRPSVNPSDLRMHFTDAWKTPYHRSFSAESQYSMPDAPRWKGSDQGGWYLQDKFGNVLYDERMSRYRD